MRHRLSQPTPPPPRSQTCRHPRLRCHPCSCCQACRCRCPGSRLCWAETSTRRSHPTGSHPTSDNSSPPSSAASAYPLASTSTRFSSSNNNSSHRVPVQLRPLPILRLLSRPSLRLRPRLFSRSPLRCKCMCSIRHSLHRTCRACRVCRLAPCRCSLCRDQTGRCSCQCSSHSSPRPPRLRPPLLAAPLSPRHLRSRAARLSNNQRHLSSSRVRCHFPFRFRCFRTALSRTLFNSTLPRHNNSRISSSLTPHNSHLSLLSSRRSQPHKLPLLRARQTQPQAARCRYHRTASLDPACPSNSPPCLAPSHSTSTPSAKPSTPAPRPPRRTLAGRRLPRLPPSPPITSPTSTQRCIRRMCPASSRCWDRHGRCCQTRLPRWRTSSRRYSLRLRPHPL